MTTYDVVPVGRIESTLVDRADAPRQADEGAPAAWIVFEPWVREAMRDLQVGDEIVVLTWLDRAERDVLVVHPRGDPANPETGVFSTRAPDRPNPVGLHPATVVAVDGLRVQVDAIETVDGTPVIDIKPRLGPRSTS